MRNIDSPEQKSGYAIFVLQLFKTRRSGLSMVYIFITQANNNPQKKDIISSILRDRNSLDDNDLVNEILTFL